MIRPPPKSTLFPYTPLFRSCSWVVRLGSATRPPLPSSTSGPIRRQPRSCSAQRSEEHTSELQSLAYIVCRLLLEKKKKIIRLSQLRLYDANEFVITDM